jgi:hypothetical protein
VPKYQRFTLLIIFGVLILGYNNCGKVQFSNSPAADVGTTSAGGPTGPGTGTGNTPPTGCVSSSFGSLCSGTPPVTPPTGAHGFFYNLTPIPDPNGFSSSSGTYANQTVAGSMNLLTSQDVIPNMDLYLTELNVPDQDWTAGFPGYPNLQEWFGLCYDASWSAPSSGTYTFVTAADDAIAIWIDGVLIGEDDDGTISSTILAENTGAGGHGPVAFAPVNLAAGPHSVELMYYQGWPTALEAQVWVMPAGTNYSGNAAPPNSDLMQLGSPINGVLNCPH